MIKDVKKDEKGIALITLVITVLILVIITTTIAKNSYDSLQLSSLTKLQNDIEVLNDRIAVYYVKNGELPTYGDVRRRNEIRAVIDDLSSNDGDKYYTIDLSELDNLTLNYGEAYMSSSTDMYIINEESHIVYYLKGIKYKGDMYHTIGKYSAVMLNY